MALLHLISSKHFFGPFNSVFYHCPIFRCLFELQCTLRTWKFRRKFLPCCHLYFIARVGRVKENFDIFLLLKKFDIHFFDILMAPRRLLYKKGVV